METLTYELRINAEENCYEQISSIIGLYPNSYDFGWSYGIKFEEKESFAYVVDNFLNSLEGKYEQLLDLDIESCDISVWLTYGYNNQCNMEFESQILKRLGDKGIKLCISCYEAGV